MWNSVREMEVQQGFHFPFLWKGRFFNLKIIDISLYLIYLHRVKI